MCLSFGNATMLGGGVRGSQPPGGLIGGGGGSTGGSGMVGSSARGRNRLILREAFGNGCFFSKLLGHKFKTGPFRMATNSGDPNGTTNSSPSIHLPGINQVGGIQGNRARSRMTIGGTHSDGDAFYTGNPKYVYDSSNYTTFRKRQAINRNYNDRSFGGDQHNGSYTALMHVRH